MDSKFSWVPLFEELATKLLIYKDDRTPLVDWIYKELGTVTREDGKSLVNYDGLDRGGHWVVIRG